LIVQNHILYVPQPSYNLDLVPSSFWLFSYLKNSFVGRRFDEPEELLEGITYFGPSLALGIARHFQPLGTSSQIDLGKQ
jgi:hypothetical protein